MAYNTLFLEMDDGNLVHVNYYYKVGEPPKTCGLPEDCHDGTPSEVHIESIEVNGVDIYPFFERFSNPKSYEKLIEAIHENES